MYEDWFHSPLQSIQAAQPLFVNSATLPPRLPWTPAFRSGTTACDDRVYLFVEPFRRRVLALLFWRAVQLPGRSEGHAYTGSGSCALALPWDLCRNSNVMSLPQNNALR